MHNAFVFNGRHGVKAYLRKLKGVQHMSLLKYWYILFIIAFQTKLLKTISCLFKPNNDSANKASTRAQYFVLES